MTAELDAPAERLGLIGSRQLIAVQTMDIARLTAHPVALIPETFIAVTGMGPTDSNESGKTSFLSAVALLLGDPEWRVSSTGAASVEALLFEPVTAGATARGTLGNQAPGGATQANPGYQSVGGAAAPSASYIASAPAPAPARSTALPRTREDLELRYMRQTRTACVFIAIIVGFFTTLIVIGTIYGVVRINDINNDINNLGNCSSQGGTNQSC